MLVKGNPQKISMLLTGNTLNTFKGHGVDGVKEAAGVWVIDIDILKWILSVHVELIGLPKGGKKTQPWTIRVSFKYTKSIWNNFSTYAPKVS